MGQGMDQHFINHLSHDDFTCSLYQFYESYYHFVNEKVH